MRAKQEIFLNELLSGASIKSAAHKCNVSERQASRWMASDELKQELSQRKERLSQEFDSGLLSASLEALETLRALLAENYPPSVRRMAASSLLESRLRWLDIVDFERRLSELEAKAWPANR